MDIFTRIKKWLAKLFVTVRKHLRRAEDGLDEKQPPRALGVFVIVLGVIFVLLGLVMLVLPGPGVLALALGIVGIIVGFKIFTGQYGPDRKRREREEKHRRLQRRRRAREND